MTATSGVDAHVSTAAISAPMVAALESAWSTIRERHPELPAVVMVLGAGSIGAAGRLRFGHFAAMRWRHQAGPLADEQDPYPATSGFPTSIEGPEVEARLPEVFIGGEGLARGPVGVLGTLLHEAAHALAHARGIKDTSRQGRYHNRKFKALAEELGITVEKDPRIGWSPTTVPDHTRSVYADTLAQLGAALRLFRALEPTTDGPAKKTPPACVCGCGRRIRVAPSVLATGPITCRVCETDFEPDTDASSDDSTDTDSGDTDSGGTDSGTEGD
jgi:hypothetical protein